VGHFVPHTDEDLKRMLADIGLTSLDQLFAVVPEALRLAGGLDLPVGLSEPDVLAEMERLAARNRWGSDLICFAGAGAYDHEVPSATKRLTFRSEFVTAYTPYQPEVAQGVLQALFEYQTLIARLSGLPVANASLYDGASAAVEGVNLAVAAKRRPTVWVSGGVHPYWRQTLQTFAAGTGHELIDVPLRDGTTDWAAADGSSRPAALLVSTPNYLGAFEDLTSARAVADANDALLVAGFDPVSSGLLHPPGESGADVAVGEGQPFGTPLSFGGPYLGLFAVKSDQVRRLPGRLVGRTVDTEGRPAYVTTLRAREQDIRREKASSNVCTNQTLIAVAAMIQLAWLGTGGLREMALRCARGARYAREALTAIPGVELLAPAPTLREFALELPVPVDTVVERMADEGFLAGVPVGLEGGVVTGPERASESTGGLLVAVTERRTRAEIDSYVSSFEKAVR
jgi:glycine dehydrogenase subunit 1